MLLFQNNPYQHHVYLTSANRVCSAVYGVFNNVTSYFHLHEINEDLHNRNALLEMEVINLRNQLNSVKLMLPDSTAAMAASEHGFDFILAHVISNSISQPQNYITINRGSLDGIAPEMGVIDQNGVVGIVNVVGPHSARVISLLNPQFRLSCKVKGSDFFGSLVWDGKDAYHAVLEEMPKHVKFAKGDTIVTSGYSSVFPKGMLVGCVQRVYNSANGMSYRLKVKLSTNFGNLRDVCVISDGEMAERMQLFEAAQDSLRGKQ